jgi:ribosomal protein S14
MILEDLTFQTFGYHTKDLKIGSHKKVINKCDERGKIRESEFRKPFNLCKSCGRKGEKSANYGKKFPPEFGLKISIKLKDRYRKGEIVPWDKGLTKETDERIMNSSIRMVNNNPMNYGEYRKKAGDANRGKKTWNSGITSEDDSRILAGINHPKYGMEVSIDTRRKISTANRGKRCGLDSPNWKGGKTSLLLLLRSSSNMIDWRKAVFERDNYTCKICGDNHGGNLNAHHIIYLKNLIKIHNIKTREESSNHLELWNISNGITLCEKCHKLVHKNKGKW